MSDKIEALRNLASDIERLENTASGLGNPLLMTLLDRARQEIEAELSGLLSESETSPHSARYQGC